MRENILVRNVAAEPAAVTIEISVDADFADLFAVKEGRTRHHGTHEIRAGEGFIELESTRPHARRGVRVRAEGAISAPGKLVFREVVPPRGEWRATVQVLPTVEGAEVAPRYPLDEPIEEGAPSIRRQE
jgi:hypothetical protein